MRRSVRGKRQTPVDAHVGSQARLRVSETQLGVALGLTVQQVQKYERGVNRVSAGNLYHSGLALGVSSGVLHGSNARAAARKAPCFAS